MLVPLVRLPLGAVTCTKLGLEAFGLGVIVDRSRSGGSRISPDAPPRAHLTDSSPTTGGICQPQSTPEGASARSKPPPESAKRLLTAGWHPHAEALPITCPRVARAGCNGFSLYYKTRRGQENESKKHQAYGYLKGSASSWDFDYLNKLLRSI